MIGPITRFVLTVAVRQLRAWQRHGIELGIAVNVSAQNLHDPELPALLERLLEESGVAPERLKIEVTESSVMSDAGRALRTLERFN